LGIFVRNILFIAEEKGAAALVPAPAFLVETQTRPTSPKSLSKLQKIRLKWRENEEKREGRTSGSEERNGLMMPKGELREQALDLSSYFIFPHFASIAPIVYK